MAADCAPGSPPLAVRARGGPVVLVLVLASPIPLAVGEGAAAGTVTVHAGQVAGSR
jgi:hypothetical protein